MPTLRSIIERIRRKEDGEDDGLWLFIAGPARDLTLDTDAELRECEIDETTHREILPPDFIARGLSSTIELSEVVSSIRWADRLSGSNDNNAALDIIRYYIRFDAWPDTLNAPDPPPPEVILRELDRQFCDKLGPENPTKPCRRSGCQRGAVNLSLFCRQHHFENIWKRPYPFADTK